MTIMMTLLTVSNIKKHATLLHDGAIIENVTQKTLFAKTIFKMCFKLWTKRNRDQSKILHRQFSCSRIILVCYSILLSKPKFNQQLN